VAKKQEPDDSPPSQAAPNLYLADQKFPKKSVTSGRRTSQHWSRWRKGFPRYQPQNILYDDKKKQIS
jgi:hypothetical protein